MEEVVIIKVSNPNSFFVKKLNQIIEEYECQKVTQKNGNIIFDKIQIYPDYHRVISEGKEVILTDKEFQILLLLAGHKGQVFSKKRIYEAIWNEDYLFEDKNLNSYINKIRKKIEKDPKNPQFIQTVWGVGYRFMAQ